MFDNVNSDITVGWDETPTFVHDYPQSGDKLGTSVAVSGTAILAGAPYQDNDDQTNTGAVYALKICNYNLIGDLNNDCRVDLLDLAALSVNWLVDCMSDPTDLNCVPKP